MDHQQITQGPPEQEEETMSEDKARITTCEIRQNVASENSTHIICEGLWHLILMKSARLCCRTDKNNMHMGAASFEELRHWVLMELAEPSHIASDGTPALLCDSPKLHTACVKLKAKVGDKRINLVTQYQIQGMLGLLNLYLDEGLDLSWRKASAVVSKTQGHGDTHAQCIREWTTKFLQTGTLPLHRLGQAWWTVLHDEDIANEIKLHIVGKSRKGFVRAEDIVNLVASPGIQKLFLEKGICKP